MEAAAAAAATAAAPAVAKAVEKSGVLDNAAEALKTFGSKDASAALENLQKFKNLVHSSSSSHMGPMQNGRGFNGVNLVLQRRGAVHHRNQMKDVFNNLMIPFVEDVFNATPAQSNNNEIRARAKRQMEGMRDLMGLSDESAIQSILFQNGSGSLSFITFGYRPLTAGSDYFHWFIVDNQATFRLAPDFVVIRHSKSNFWKTTSRDEIQYLERGLSAQDVADLVSQMLICHHGIEQLLALPSPAAAQAVIVQ